MRFKAPLAIGVVAFIGATLWMREIASWRPQVVARLGLNEGYMVLSRDGRRMLIGGMVNKPGLETKTVVLDLENIPVGTGITPASTSRQIRDFWKKNASALHLSLNKSQTQLIYTPPRGKPVLLEGKIEPQSFDFDARGEGADSFEWFPARHEIHRYGYGGDTRIWDSRTGRLKSHLRNHGVLSPDGLSSLSTTLSPQGVNALIRTHVPGGQFAAVIDRNKTGMSGLGVIRVGDCGWSPDGKFIWFVRQDFNYDPLDLNVVRASDSKKMWSAPCAGAAKWLPDGRIGLMQRDGFSFRDASGREIGHLSGPLPGPSFSFFNANDWEVSPDGKWIYELDNSKGILRRWRAK